MSYLVIARKYRPLAFDTVAGQEHVTKTLRNSIERNKIPHALLFTGPRGVGKTSIARIFSKCLNCAEGPTTTPCLTCINCKEIANSNSMAVREIDGASHNSVDNVRELIENFRTLPPPGAKYKIYIIDEVHMLSTAAFNALLKSLEEPPPHTVFILATTEVHKIPITVLSRCQRHDLRALPASTIEGALAEICDKEKVSVEPGVLSLVARVAEGSMRDAETALERLLLFADQKKVTAKDATAIFGAADSEALAGLSSSIFAKNPKAALTIVDDLLKSGSDITSIIRDFVAHFRELVLAKIAGVEFLKAQGITDATASEMYRQVQPIDELEVQDIAYLARQGGDEAIRSSFPKFAFEALIARLATRMSVVDVASLLSAPPTTSAGSGSARTASTPTASPAARQSAAAQTHSTAAPSSKSAELSWGPFVSFCQSNARILAEQLKRVSPKIFTAGSLHLTGPEFSINYLDKKEAKDKLEQLLQSFSNTSTVWKITFEKDAAAVQGAAIGSLKEIQETKLSAQKKTREGEILSSPSIQAIQDLFPGSKIEVKS